MTNFKYALGCHKDSLDSRDRPLTRLPKALKVVLPPKVDYTPKMSPVSDQGQEGTCVGFAVVDGTRKLRTKDIGNFRVYRKASLHDLSI